MKPKRYFLTKKGLQSLRRSIQLSRAWTHSNRPKTPEGKQMSSINAFKHGARCKKLYRLPRLEPLNP